MQLESQYQKIIDNEKEELEDEFTFKVILKFWKKESKNARVVFTASQCANEEVFVKSIRSCFHIKSAHCLEELWVLQEMTEYDKPLTWIKQLNGRIMIDIPASYKDFLINKGLQLGLREFEDPLYINED
jgi:hypothetical protein